MLDRCYPINASPERAEYHYPTYTPGIAPEAFNLAILGETPKNDMNIKKETNTLLFDYIGLVVQAVVLFTSLLTNIVELWELIRNIYFNLNF